MFLVALLEHLTVLETTTLPITCRRWISGV